MGPPQRWGGLKPMTEAPNLLTKALTTMADQKPSRRKAQSAPGDQRQRFIDFAREHEADDPDALENAMKTAAIRTGQAPNKDEPGA